MIEGVIHHCTEMEVDRQYVDSHGQSTVAFAFCRLLGFQLMPRLKAIHSQKLYRPETGKADAYANLQQILTKPIYWDSVRQQYDQMVKYASRIDSAEGVSLQGLFMVGPHSSPIQAGCPATWQTMERGVVYNAPRNSQASRCACS